MIIPSENLYMHLLNVSRGIFFEIVNIDTKYSNVDLVAKLPAEIIKSICLGSSTFLSIKFIPIRNSLALCTILAVEDDPKAMLYVCRTHSPKDVDRIIQFLNQDQIELHVFDELNRNVASFKGFVSVPDSIIKNLLHVKPSICQLSDEEITTILLNLEEKLSKDGLGLKLIRFDFKNEIAPNFYHCHTIANAPIYDSNRFNDPYHIRDSNQGRQFEINLTHLLSKIFDSDCLFPSPFGATPNSQNREFIDLVVVWEDNLLFFEAKASAITFASLQRSTKRRVNNIEKKIKKAISQLRGAYKKAVYNGILTLKSTSCTREIDLSLFSVHLIIIVSEVHPDLAKSDVVTDVLSLGKEVALGVHVLDLQALSSHIIHCKDANEFIKLLNLRWKLSLKYDTIYFRDDRLTSGD